MILALEAVSITCSWIVPNRSPLGVLLSCSSNMYIKSLCLTLARTKACLFFNRVDELLWSLTILVLVFNFIIIESALISVFAI